MGRERNRARGGAPREKPLAKVGRDVALGAKRGFQIRKPTPVGGMPVDELSRIPLRPEAALVFFGTKLRNYLLRSRHRLPALREWRRFIEKDVFGIFLSDSSLVARPSNISTIASLGTRKKLRQPLPNGRGSVSQCATTRCYRAAASPCDSALSIHPPKI